jgi:hypothetical protein
MLANSTESEKMTTAHAARISSTALGEAAADGSKTKQNTNVVALIDTFDNILNQTARLSSQLTEHSSQLMSKDAEEKEVIQKNLVELKTTIDKNVEESKKLAKTFNERVDSLETMLSDLLQNMEKVFQSAPASKFLQLVSTLVTDPRETWKVQGMLEMVVKEREKFNKRFKKVSSHDTHEMTLEDKNTMVQSEIALKRQELDLRTSLMDLRSGLIKQLWAEFESRVTKLNALLDRNYLKQYDDLFIQFQSTSTSIAQFQRNQAALKCALVDKRNKMHECWTKLEQAQDVLLKQLAPKCGDPQFATKILQAFPSYKYGMEPVAADMNPDNITNNCLSKDASIELLRAQEFGGALIGPSPDSFHTDTIACWPPGSGKTNISAAAIHAFYQRYLVQESIREHNGSFADNMYEIPPCGAFVLTNEPSQVIDFVEKCQKYFTQSTKCKDDVTFEMVSEDQYLNSTQTMSTKYTAVFTLAPQQKKGHASVFVPSVPFTCVVHTYFHPLPLQEEFLSIRFQTITNRTKRNEFAPWNQPRDTATVARMLKATYFLVTDDLDLELPQFSTEHLLPYGHALIIVDEIHAFTDFAHDCSYESWANRIKWTFAIVWSTNKKMLSSTGTPFANVGCLNQFFRIIKLHLGRGLLEMPSWYDVSDLFAQDKDSTMRHFVIGTHTSNKIKWYKDLDPNTSQHEGDYRYVIQQFWMRALFDSDGHLTQKAKEKMWKMHAGLFSYFTLANDPTRFPSRLQYLDVNGNHEAKSFRRLNVLTSRYDGYQYTDAGFVSCKADSLLRSTMHSIPIFCKDTPSKIQAALRLIHLDPNAKHFFFFEGAESRGNNNHEASTRQDMNVWLKEFIGQIPTSETPRYVYLSQWGILDMMLLAMTRVFRHESWTKFNAEQIAHMLYNSDCKQTFLGGAVLPPTARPLFMDQFRFFRQNGDVVPPKFILLFKDISYIKQNSGISKMALYEQILKLAMTPNVLAFPVFMQDDIADLTTVTEFELYQKELTPDQKKYEIKYLRQQAQMETFNTSLQKYNTQSEEEAEQVFEANGNGIKDLKMLLKARIDAALQLDKEGYVLVYEMAKQLKMKNVLTTVTDETSPQKFGSSQLNHARKDNIISAYIRFILEPYEQAVISNPNQKDFQSPEEQQNEETEFLSRVTGEMRRNAENKSPEEQEKQREVINKLSGSFFGSIMMALYNHEANKDGDYFQILFGNSNIAMGHDIMSTRNVHFPKPPSTLAVRQQARDRTARFCCFKQHKDPNTWWTRDIVFIAPDEQKLFKQTNNDILEQLKRVPEEGALDCYLFRAFNTGKGQPYECMDDSGRVSKGPNGLKVEFGQTAFFFVTLPKTSADGAAKSSDTNMIQAQYTKVTTDDVNGFAITTLRIPAQYTPFYEFVQSRLQVPAPQPKLPISTETKYKLQMLQSIQAVFHLLKSLSVTMDPMQWIQMENDIVAYMNSLCRDHRDNLKNMISHIQNTSSMKIKFTKFDGFSNIEEEKLILYNDLKKNYEKYKKQLNAYNVTKSDLIKSLHSGPGASQPSDEYEYMDEETAILSRGLSGSSRLLRNFK